MNIEINNDYKSLNCTEQDDLKQHLFFTFYYLSVSASGVGRLCLPGKVTVLALHLQHGFPGTTVNGFENTGG